MVVGNLYSIYDRVAEQFGPVALCKNDAVAVRMAVLGLKEARLDDYRLFHVGEFDDERGLLTACDKREVSMVSAKEE